LHTRAPSRTEFCECQSQLGVTALAAKQVYSHLGYPNGRDDISSEGFRLDTIHVWGTQDLSTSDLLQWTAEFSPKNIEWIDDFSCKLPFIHLRPKFCLTVYLLTSASAGNIVFANENMALRVLNKLAEPFDRRVALAAMVAVAAVMDKKAPLASGEDTEMGEDGEGKTQTGLRGSQTHPLSFSTGSLKSITENMPASGRWFKATTSPDRAFSLFLRFAHKSSTTAIFLHLPVYVSLRAFHQPRHLFCALPGDVKLPGAERRSNYYKRYGNPNYSGMVGILSRSFRRRAQAQHRHEGASDSGSGDLRRVHYLFCDCGQAGDHLSSSLPQLATPACCCCSTNGSATAMDTSLLAQPSRQDRRKLVSYEDLYEDDFVDDSDDLADLARDFDEGLISVRSDIGANRSSRVSTRAGNRREAAACGLTSPKQPRKWPRNERAGGQMVFDRLGGSSDRIATFKPSADSREPWAGELTTGEDFRGFKGNVSRPTASSGRVSAKQRLGSRHSKALATITLLPDLDMADPHRPLTSMRMVADLEEANVFSQTGWVLVRAVFTSSQCTAYIYA
uniref:Nuclear cap-binding protein subunit 3 n=1 Tax=Schistocephalus solidus TaxID=70667 RepID=A0A183T8L2_SCHSO